jgi:hypothetical protein
VRAARCRSRVTLTVADWGRQDVGAGRLDVRLIVVACLLVACTSTAPIAVAPPLPQRISEELAAKGFDRFTPPTALESTMARIDAGAAVRAAQSSSSYVAGPDGRELSWRGVGCVYMAIDAGMRMPHDAEPPQPSLVYLVQMFTEQVAEWSAPADVIVIVDAVTGRTRSSFGSFGGSGDPCPT